MGNEENQSFNSIKIFKSLQNTAHGWIKKQGDRRSINYLSEL
jgi:hypothetical protein